MRRSGDRTGEAHRSNDSRSAAQQAQTGGTATIPIGADPVMNPWHPNAFVESLFVNRVLFAGLTKPGQGPRSGAGPGLELEDRAPTA